MKNLLKMSLLSVVIGMSVTSCDPAKTSGGVVDTPKKDVVILKPDTTKSDSIKK